MSRTSTSSRPCPLCEAVGLHLRPLARLPAPLGRVWRCRRCGLVFVDPLPTPGNAGAGYYTHTDVEQYARYYGPFRTRVADAALRQIETWRAPGKLLDVGCAAGWFLAVAADRGWQGMGLEPSWAMARQCRARGLDVVCASVAEIGALGDTYDAITLWNVLEHVPEALTALRRIREKLNPGGVLAVSVPNFEGLFSRIAFGLYRLSGGQLRAPLEILYQADNPSMHVYHFTPATLRAFIHRAGFDVVGWGLQDVMDVDRLAERVKLLPAGRHRWLLSFRPVQHLVSATFHLSRRLGWQDEIAMYALRQT